MTRQNDISLIDATLTQAFAASVALGGNRLALQTDTATLTYGELDAYSDRIADALVRAGIGSGSNVALMLEQGAAFISGALGVLKAGAAFVPLDPTYPIDRNRFMADDSRAACVLTHNASRHLATAIADDRFILNIDRLDDSPRPEPLAAIIQPDDLAYVLYTSGSTGKPKGVMQPHRSVTHNAHRHLVHFGLRRDDRQSLLYPCSVYGGIRDIFNALLCGAALYHYPVREAGYAELGKWIAEHAITVYCSVASVFRRFARTLEGTAMFEHLRIVKLGGEAPYATDVELFRNHFCSRTVFFCGLGSTETGMSRRYPMRAEDTLDTHAIPLGYGIDGLDVVLVDEERMPVAPGETGEIAIRSRYITTGYIGRDDLTANALTTHATEPGVRTFYTGDLGRFDDEGRLWHRGRKDHQVKIRGNRVELSEIEAALASHAAIRDTVVLAEADETGVTRLVAYAVIEPGATAPTVFEVRESLKDRLPRFMIPGIYRVVGAIPLTPNGKIDRIALPTTPFEALTAGRAHRPPTTDIQRRLAAIFESILKHDGVGISDSFFDLGGDSLQAVDLMIRIEREFAQVPSLKAIVALSSVEELAGWLASGDAVDSDRRSIALNDASEATRPPLFILPGKGGSVMSFLALTQRLGRDRQVFGLQFPGLGDNERPIDRFSVLADEMLRGLEEAVPIGPVALLGYSFGGLLAYELACRLVDRGRGVDRLVLIDSTVPGARRRRSAIRRMTLHARKIVERSREEGLRYLVDRLRPAKQPTGENKPRPVDGDILRNRLWELARASERAAARFKPKTYEGGLSLLQCVERPGWMRFVEIPEDHGWSSTCSGMIDRVSITGLHNEVMRPQHIDGLADAIRSALA